MTVFSRPFWSIDRYQLYVSATNGDPLGRRPGLGAIGLRCNGLKETENNGEQSNREPGSRTEAGDGDPMSADSQGTPLVSGSVDVPAFNREGLIKDLRIDQAGESTSRSSSRLRSVQALSAMTSISKRELSRITAATERNTRKPIRLLRSRSDNDLLKPSGAVAHSAKRPSPWREGRKPLR